MSLDLLYKQQICKKAEAPQFNRLYSRASWNITLSCIKQFVPHLIAKKAGENFTIVYIRSEMMKIMGLRDSAFPKRISGTISQGTTIMIRIDDR